MHASQPGKKEPAAPKDAWDKFGIVVAAFQSLLTVVIASLVGWFGIQYNRTQSDLRSADLLRQAILDLSDRSEQAAPKRALTKIAVAVYGHDALPTIRMLLQASRGDLRQDGVEIVEHIFTTNQIARSELFFLLLRDSESASGYLRLGSLEALAQVAESFSERERSMMLSLASRVLSYNRSRRLSGSAAEPSKSHAMSCDLSPSNAQLTFSSG